MKMFQRLLLFIQATRQQMSELDLVSLHDSVKRFFAFHCVKSVDIWRYFGQYFPAFGLNTERYSVSSRIQCECGGIRIRITPNTDAFYAVFDMQNYARLTPIYLAEIYALKETDPHIWYYFERGT